MSVSLWADAEDIIFLEHATAVRIPRPPKALLAVAPYLQEAFQVHHAMTFLVRTSSSHAIDFLTDQSRLNSPFFFFFSFFFKRPRRTLFPIFYVLCLSKSITDTTLRLHLVQSQLKRVVRLSTNEFRLLRFSRKRPNTHFFTIFQMSNLQIIQHMIDTRFKSFASKEAASKGSVLPSCGLGIEGGADEETQKILATYKGNLEQAASHAAAEVGRIPPVDENVRFLSCLLGGGFVNYSCLCPNPGDVSPPFLSLTLSLFSPTLPFIYSTRVHTG